MPEKKDGIENDDKKDVDDIEGGVIPPNSTGNSNQV